MQLWQVKQEGPGRGWQRAARAEEDEAASTNHSSEGAGGEVERRVKRVL